MASKQKTMKNDILCHHGIKGQKWGVRRFQNKDGSLTPMGKKRMLGSERKSMLVRTQLGMDIPAKRFQKLPRDDDSKDLIVKKGEKVTHVTPADFKQLKPGQDLYVSATKYDMDTYRAFLSLMLRHKGFDKKSIKEVEFTLKEDLKSPSNKKQKKIFETAYKNNKDLYDKDMADYYSKHKNKPSDKYDAFIKTLDAKGESKKDFYKALKDNGYNAVLDQHDVNESWMFAKRPLIVMDALNTLGDMKVSDITDIDIKKSLNDLDISKE